MVVEYVDSRPCSIVPAGKAESWDARAVSDYIIPHVNGEAILFI